ncbi:MAG TPA: fibronectin type III domain-containing protein [Candidatus Thermoplasmatota archaeon]|nr:fibronectin type III domain-containing protein [Candidatus Thermoplasmatota archaeon]
MAFRSAAVRDAVVLVVVFGVLLGGLFLYTGSWPPAVIVESGSMMHADADVSYGRFGTIDPGDLVLVKDVDDINDIQTLVEGGRERYGKPGDVVIYYPANNRARTPIIHRAVAYVEVEDGPTYYVRWGDAPCEGGATKVERDGRPWCQYGADGIYVPSVPIQGFGSTRSEPNPYRPLRSGFITKGDNPVTNTQTDQLSGLSHDERGTPVPVQMEWVEGKGRAELPWLGLIKLALAGKPNEANPPGAWVKVGSAYAPKDLWVMLAITLFLLVGVPLLYDGYKAYQARVASRALPASPAAVSAQDTSHSSVRLSWSHVNGAIHAYRIYRGDERVASTPQTWFEDTDVAPDTAYTYSVSAVNEYGNEGPRSPSVTVRTPPPPQA